MMETKPEYEIDLVLNHKFDSALVIRKGDEVVAELDVRHGPAAPSPSVGITEKACKKVFAGHHWTYPNYAAPNRHRYCELCGLRQVQNRSWKTVSTDRTWEEI